VVGGRDCARTGPEKMKKGPGRGDVDGKAKEKKKKEYGGGSEYNEIPRAAKP